MKQHEIKVVTRLQDNGDGGYTMYVYNDLEEMLKDHPLAKDFKEVDGVWGDYPKPLSEEEREDILHEVDPHTYGYLGSETIAVQVDDQGKPSLAKAFSIHAGQ